MLQFSAPGYHRWTVPKCTASVGSPILSKQETLVLTVNDTTVNPVVYTSLVDRYYTGSPEELTLTVKQNNIIPVVYTQVGSVPI